MIVTLTGSNSFALNQRARDVIGTFIKNHGELALERFDGEEVAPESVIGALQSLPFLAKKKMVVLRDPSKSKNLAEQIEQIISSTGDDVDLLFIEPEIDRRTSFFRVLKSQTQMEEFNDLDAPGLAKWLINEAKMRSGALGFSDASYMVERLGTNQSLLANELEKLLIHEPHITRASIDLLSVPNPNSRIFELLDAAFNGKKEKALSLYEDQRAQRVEPQAILAMISWQLQQIAVVKYAGTKTAGEVAKDSGMKEYPLSKAMSLAAQLEEKMLGQLVSDALQIDLLGKTTPIDMDEALKNYIIKF